MKQTSLPAASLAGIKKELRAAADPARARNLAWFFKTGKGQYGEGDVFIGVTVPELRSIAKRHRGLPLADVGRLLDSRIHEHRLAALEILVMQYEAGEAAAKRTIFDFYLNHTGRINNWDLVDASAPYIVGEQLVTKSKGVLKRLAKSQNVWERRIAMVATLALIGKGDLKPTFTIADLLLDDRHDLIHKAIGWTLREAGKRSEKALLEFLERNYQRIPRTSLRYAIERFPEQQRKQLLAGVFHSRFNRPV